MRTRSRASRAHARARPARRGAALVLFALLVFALLAVATLAVDLGLAQLTQAQMQDAADTAALEGQRWRQFAAENFTGVLSRTLRRAKAAELERLVFDDDLDLAADAAGYGAGPVLERSDAHDGLGGVLAPGDPSVWKPSPQLNEDNLGAGDFVSGLLELAQPSAETSDYQRADFTPLAFGPTSWLGEAFLVRLRRTGAPVAEDELPSSASHGPGLPLLFGHGAPIHADGTGWDPREDGLTVRATAIALARPALSVGATPHDASGATIRQSTAPPPGYSISQAILDTFAYYDHLGAAPFVLTLDYWPRYPIGNPGCVVVRVESDAQGLPIRVLRAWDSAAQAAGEIVGWYADDVRQLGREARATVLADSGQAVPQRVEGYVPVVARVAGPAGELWRVIGFGHADLVDPTLLGEEANCHSDSPADVMRALTRHDTRLPVSGVHAGFLEPADPLEPQEWQQLFQLNRQHFDTVPESASILAPALAR